MAYKICVYAICKNESKFVDKWLNNMSEADYIVVLDTGSTDGTFEKLQADPRVTKVKQKIISPWRFDNARNESMKLVPKDADILVCTDFDELFNKGWADTVRRAWNPEKYNRVFYNYAWSHNTVGEPTDIFKYDKIHTRDFKWKFPVHEVLWAKDETTTTVRAIDLEDTLLLEHFPDNTKERNYYFDLLELAVKENPEDCHERMLLAREYLLKGEYDSALEHYMATLEMTPDIDRPEKKLVLLESLGRVADLYRVKGNTTLALWYCHEFIKNDPTYREPYLIMAEIYNDSIECPTLAESCIEAALKYATRKYTWVERANTWMDWLPGVLSAAKYKLGDYEAAIKNVQEALKHNPNDVTLLKNYAIYLEAKLAEVKAKLPDNE